MSYYHWLHAIANLSPAYWSFIDFLMNQSRTENIDRRVLADLLATSSVAVKCLVHCRHSTFGHPAVCCFPGGTLAFGGTLDKITITTFQCAGHNHGFLHIFKEKCMSMITFKVIKCFIFTLEVFYFEMITFYICSYLILMPFLKLCAQKLHLTFTEGITGITSFQIQVWRYLALRWKIPRISWKSKEQFWGKKKKVWNLGQWVPEQSSPVWNQKSTLCLY